MTNYYLSVVIPAYNEEKKIAQDLALVYDYLARQTYEYEVLVVDDGSKDRTYEIVKSLEPKCKNLRGIRYEQNRGKGYAVKTGVLQARGEYILFADAGTCVPYQDMEKGLQVLQNGYDVALGSRALEESRVLLKQPKYRQIGSTIFGFIVHWVMGVNPVRDTQCGFKVFKREAAHAIFGRNRIDGFMFDTETILNAKKLGLRLKEFPVTWKNDPDTRFNPVWGSVRNLKELWKIKFSR
ncbi:MAG: dolichyl-phosphate beta-glucosyltransferase [Bacteroidota bacterium]